MEGTGLTANADARVPEVQMGHDVVGIDPLRAGEMAPPPPSLTPEWMHLPSGWLEAAGRTGVADHVPSDGWDRPAARPLSRRKQKRLERNAAEPAAVAISTMVSGDGRLAKEKSTSTEAPVSLLMAVMGGVLGSWAWYQGVLRLDHQLPWAPIFIGVVVSWVIRLGVPKRDGARITVAVLVVLISALSTISAILRFGDITPFTTRNLSWTRLPTPVNPIQMIVDVHSVATKRPVEAVMAIGALILCGVLTSHEI